MVIDDVTGTDVKLAALMEPQVSVAQPQQQGPTAGAGQQSYPAAAAAAAMHPGYSYYYPPAAGMVPYYTPMIPVGGVVSDAHWMGDGVEEEAFSSVDGWLKSK